LNITLMRRVITCKILLEIKPKVKTKYMICSLAKRNEQLSQKA